MQRDVGRRNNDAAMSDSVACPMGRNKKLSREACATQWRIQTPVKHPELMPKTIILQMYNKRQ